MFAHPPDPASLLTRRSALLGGLGCLALPASAWAATPAETSVWPRALQVPGGIARLPLGASATRPVAHLPGDGGPVPLLVLGDASQWTALVGIALSAEPGEA